MKRIVLLPLLALLIVSCSQGHQHEYVLNKADSSTCIKHGHSKDYYSCSSCDKYFDIDTKQEIDISTIELPFSDHEGGVYKIKENYHVEICKHCGVTLKDAESHEYDRQSPKTDILYDAGDCLHHPSYYYSCVCGKSSKDTLYEDTYIDESGAFGDHKYLYVPRQEAIGDDDGYEEHYECELCHKYFDLYKNEINQPTVIPANPKIMIMDKYRGKEVEIIYDKAKEYLNTDNPAKYLYNFVSSAGEYTGGISFKWKFNGSAISSTFELSDTDTFGTIIYSQPVSIITSLTLYNLAPGKYYYHIKNSEYTSVYDYFIIKKTVRAINTVGGIFNMRDLGGWKTKDGKSVKYSKLYRSAHWGSATNTTDIRLKELGMKTELDIRRGDSYAESQHPITGINYINLGIGQYTGIVPGAKYSWPGASENLKAIFEVLAADNNYPLTFHCTAGADRTGTLAFLILGLLGVDYKDICKDFELTSIYYSKRWRSNIIVNGDNYTFDPSGIMQDDSSNYVAFNALYDAMISTYPASDNKLSTSIYNYLTTYLKVSDDTINNVKNNLLE